MDTKKFDELYKELKGLIAKGDEAKVKSFLVEHFEEFPKEMQDNLIMLFFEESLSKIVGGQDQAVADFQQQGLAAIKDMEATKKGLEDKLKALEVKESLQASDN
ncbi:MAG: hypothetical protein HQ530_04020 [Parcubacteria group bacterium]|nr:hypothetical protein [Parcubacteria group bacterium]